MVLNAADFRELEVIDADTHVVEPPDLWTSRMSTAKWGDLVPHVAWDDEIKEEQWYVGNKAIYRGGKSSMAGWHEYAPLHPTRFEDMDPYHWDPKLRLDRMDEYGIRAQVLYPNIGIFAAAEYLAEGVDPLFATECVRAYNDYLAGWHSVAPDRYIPVATLPIWDIEATKAEMVRVKELGHKGIVMSSQPENFGLPPLDSHYWDQLWAPAQEMSLPVNFHIGSGKIVAYGEPENGVHTNYAWTSAMIFQGNVRTLACLTLTGVCHRFPGLQFVSVESGIGWIPSLLETLDWQFQNCGGHIEHPEYEMLPSEYFKRQIFGCFWFEQESALSAIELLGPDRFLYETDFPHPTSMSPGPASAAVAPLEYMVDTLGKLPEGTVRRLVHDNAAELYGL